MTFQRCDRPSLTCAVTHAHLNRIEGAGIHQASEIAAETRATLRKCFRTCVAEVVDDRPSQRHRRVMNGLCDESLNQSDIIPCDTAVIAARLSLQSALKELRLTATAATGTCSDDANLMRRAVNDAPTLHTTSTESCDHCSKNQVSLCDEVSKENTLWPMQMAQSSKDDHRLHAVDPLILIGGAEAFPPVCSAPNCTQQSMPVTPTLAIDHEKMGLIQRIKRHSSMSFSEFYHNRYTPAVRAQCDWAAASTQYRWAAERRLVMQSVPPPPYLVSLARNQRRRQLKREGAAQREIEQQCCHTARLPRLSKTQVPNASRYFEMMSLNPTHKLTHNHYNNYFKAVTIRGRTVTSRSEQGNINQGKADKGSPSLPNASEAFPLINLVPADDTEVADVCSSPKGQSPRLPSDVLSMKSEVLGAAQNENDTPSKSEKDRKIMECVTYLNPFEIEAMQRRKKLISAANRDAATETDVKNRRRTLMCDLRNPFRKRPHIGNAANLSVIDSINCPFPHSGTSTSLSSSAALGYHNICNSSSSIGYAPKSDPSFTAMCMELEAEAEELGKVCTITRAMAKRAMEEQQGELQSKKVRRTDLPWPYWNALAAEDGTDNDSDEHEDS